MSQQDPKLQNVQYKSIDFVPRLRRNKQIDHRWGTPYYDAVKTAVFNTQSSAFMPEDPPQIIKESIDKTGYVCKQCRDCFRFLSSIEEHTSRRSWVLGYWCQQCFATTCTHKTKGKTSCKSCVDLLLKKHNYLEGKGMKKGVKKGVTRIFYNQCQFFAHLKVHGTALVDLSELMLMPLPCGIEPEHHNRYHKIWKSVMEIMFVKRIHIMDWTRDKKIVWNAILDSNLKPIDPIAKIVDSYREDCIGDVEKSEPSQRQDNPIQFDDIRVTTKTNATRTNSNKSRSNTNNKRRNVRQVVSAPIRSPDDAIVPKDIAFVDCGSVPSDYIFETSDLSPTDPTQEPIEPETNTCDDNSPMEMPEKQIPSRDNPLWQTLIKKWSKHRNKSPQTIVKSGDEESSTMSTTITRSGANVLTIRNPTNLSLSAIINHLPNNTLKCKNIVLSGTDSQTKNAISESSSESSSNSRDRSTTLESSFAKIQSSSIIVPVNNKKKIETLTKPKNHDSTSILKNDKTTPTTTTNKVATSQSFSEQMSLHGKILFQNGRKYIIRHVPKSESQNLKRLILPKPPSPIVPSNEKIPAKLPVVTVKTPRKFVRILPNAAQSASTGMSLVTLNKTLLDENRKAERRQWHQSFVRKIREAMENEFRQMGRKKLEVCMENLREINDIYAKATGFHNDTIIASNLKTIEHFQQMANCLPPEDSPELNDNDHTAVETIFDRNAKNWEFNVLDSRKRSCGICRKRSKLSSYIVGMSPPAREESLYCHCYNNICYLCNVNQGNLVQLKIHIKWHRGEKPFVCPDCARVFNTAKDLEIHVWTTCFHPMSRQIYGCAICQIDGMLDMESVTKHFMLFHARRKIICSECKFEYTDRPLTKAHCDEHYANHHPNITKIPDPKLLLICSLKQCVVWPELFRPHLSNHMGITRSMYYECPFCSTVAQGSKRDKTAILQHLTENHLNRLREVVSDESLPHVVKRLRLYANTDDNCRVDNDNSNGPMIINARTITSETFEQGSVDSSEHGDDTIVPKILNVRSEAMDSFENDSFHENNFPKPRIIAIESITENSTNASSPKIHDSDVATRESMNMDVDCTTDDNDSEIALKKNATLSKGEAIADDSSDSDEPLITAEHSDRDDYDVDANVTFELPKLERKPSSLSEGNDNDDDSSRDCDVILDYQTGIITESETHEYSRRPCRIALNNPTCPETTPVPYNCHVCGDLIDTSWSVIKNHFNSRHSSDYELSVISPKISQITEGYIDGGYRDDCQGRKRRIEATGTTMVGSKRKRRWGPKKYSDKPGSPSLGICVRPEPVREIEGIFRCKKCHEPFADITTMREHIATKHRIKGQYLICLECGENFVVVPSLQMHLKALHGIQDPISYMTEHTSYAPDVPEDTEEDEITTESNQCYVCMAVFADKPAVDKHLRVHGMAFLKRNRFEARRAQNSWKKNSVTENDNNIVTSPDEKSSPDKTDDSKMQLNNVEPTNEHSDDGDCRTNDLQTCAKSLDKHLKDSGGVDNSTSSDDASSNVHDFSTTSQSGATSSMETTGSSRDM